jgi:hypothetical protein
LQEIVLAEAIIEIHECIQDDQTLGADNVGMTSRVRFDIQVGDKQYSDCWVEVTQSFGVDFETGPLMVGTPKGYPAESPWNTKEFSAEVEKFYRAIVSGDGHGIRLRSAARGNRLRNNRVTTSYRFVLQLS